MASNKLKQIIIDAKEIRKEVERRAQRTILAENSGKLDSLIRKLLSEGEEEQSLKPGDDDSFAPDEPAVPTDNVPTNARNIENGTEPVNPNGEADESGQISDIADLLNGLDAEELAALVNNMDTTEEPSDTDLPAANPEDTTAAPEETKTDITSTTIDEPTADQAPTEKTPSTEPEFMETKQPAMNDEEITRIMKEAEDYFKEDKDVVIAHRETQDQVTKDSTKMDGEEKPLNEEKDIYKQDKPAGKPTEKGIRPDEQAKKTQMVYEGSGVDKAAADYGKGYPSYETQTKGGDGVKSRDLDVICDRHIREKHRHPNHDDYVAQVSFGFWYSYFFKRFDPLIWHKKNALESVFPNMPKEKRLRKLIQPELLAVKNMRNRIAHHEPVWNTRPNIMEAHRICRGLIIAMSPEAFERLKQVDRLLRVWDHKESA